MEYNFNNNKLKDLRIEKGISQHKLSVETGLSQANLSRWENGIIIPNVIDMWRLADYYGVSIDYLIGKEID